jgi:hypothetical protein
MSVHRHLLMQPMKERHMQEVQIGGTVMIPVGNSIWTVAYVEWNNRAWLTPLWLQSSDGTKRRPVRLIAPKFAPGHTPIPGPDVLKIFQKFRLTAAVLEQGHIPAELGPIVEIVENPEIFIAVSAAVH